MEIIIEGFSSPLNESRFDRNAMIIHGAAILGATSLNGRDYPVSTQRAAAHLFEGAKAFLNHPYPENMAKPRKVEDLIGEWRNVRETGGKLKGDLHLLDKSLVRETVLPIVESKPHLAGN